MAKFWACAHFCVRPPGSLISGWYLMKVFIVVFKKEEKLLSLKETREKGKLKNCIQQGQDISGGLTKRVTKIMKFSWDQLRLADKGKKLQNFLFCKFNCSQYRLTCFDENYSIVLIVAANSIIWSVTQQNCFFVKLKFPITIFRYNLNQLLF